MLIRETRVYPCPDFKLSDSQMGDQRYAIRDMRYAIRDMRYAIRDMRYAIRDQRFAILEVTA